MSIINQAHHFIFIIAAFLAVLTAYRLFSYRTPMSIWAGCFLLSLAVDLSSYAIQLVIEPNSPIYPYFFLAQIISFSISWIFWFLFIISNSGSSIGKALKTILYGFCGLAVILGVLALNNQSVIITPVNTGLVGSINEPPHLSKAASSFMSFYFLGISILSTIFVLNLFRISDKPSRNITFQMLLGTLVMTILTMLEMVGFHLAGPLNLTQIGLAIFSFVYFLVTFAWQFGGRLPISRETFFDGTNDGVLILNFHHEIIDINGPAEKILQIRKKNAVRKNLSDIWQSGEQLIAKLPMEEYIEVESIFHINGEDYTYDTSIKRMPGLNETSIGWLVVFRNITERDRMERIIQDRSQDLQRANAMLQALAVVNSNIQTATNPQNFFEILRKTLKELGISFFIAQVDPQTDDLLISYLSSSSTLMTKVERILKTKIIGFRLDQKQFKPLYKIFHAKEVSLKPYIPADLKDGPEIISLDLLGNVLSMIGLKAEMPSLILPLVTRERNLGIIGMWGSDISEANIPVFRIFADQIASALEKAILFDIETKRSTELLRVNKLVMALSKVAMELQRSSNSEALLDILGKELTQMGLNCAVVTLDETKDNALIAYLSFSQELIKSIENLTGLKIINHKIPRKFWPGERILHYPDPIWYPKPGEIFKKMFPGVPESAYNASKQLLGFGDGGQLCILPLRNGETAIGAMPIWGLDLNPADSPFLSVFGSQVTGILQNMLNLENEKNRANELVRSNTMIMALSNVATQLDATTELSQVLNTLGNELARVDIHCMVGTFDDAKENLVIEYLSFTPETIKLAEKFGIIIPDHFPIPRKLWPTDKAITERVPYWESDPVGSISKMFPYIPKMVFSKFIEKVRMKKDAQVCYLPMISEENVIGILAVWGPHLHYQDIPGLTVFSNQVATAIRNTRMYNLAQKEIIKRTEAEAQTREALHEKEILLKEVHHRVKNNLQVISSLLNLQSSQLSDPASIDSFRESQNRVRSMALIHEKLYQSNDLANIDFANYLQSLASSLAQTYRVDPDTVEIKIKSEKISLSLDTAIPCGLIVNELVSNSIKYAFPNNQKGTIEVNCHKMESGCYVLAVSDDGIGLPVGMDIRQSKSLGLKLVTSLVRQIDGTLDVQGKHGASYTIAFNRD